MSQAELQAALAELASSLGDAPGPLAALRREGRTAFGALGLPTTRQEEWRYTSLKPLEEVAPSRASETGSESVSFEPVRDPAARLVFVDGRFRADLSIEASGENLQVERLAESKAPLGQLVDAKQHAFAALNGALVEDGARIRIGPGADLSQPIHVVFVTAARNASVTAPRVLVEAGAGSRAVVIEDHLSLGSDAKLVCGVTELHVAGNAALEHVLLQRASDATCQVSHLAARLERDARVTTHTLTLGGRLVRNDLEAVLAGEGAACTLRGLTVGRGEALIDNHTLVDHAVPHCSSDELYKTVLGGHSKGVFRGRVIVRPQAQKTDARQSNPNLLLSDDAEVSSKPQLEIYADDVKCSHGSSIGRLDDDALFYLRTRGIGEREARALLTRGFVAEILESLPGDHLGPALEAAFSDRFAMEESA